MRFTHLIALVAAFTIGVLFATLVAERKHAAYVEMTAGDFADGYADGYSNARRDSLDESYRTGESEGWRNAMVEVRENGCQEDMPCWNCATMGNKRCGGK